MSRRRSLLPVAAFLTVCLATPAPAATGSRIVHGGLAQPGEYPAQGYLGVDTDLDGDPNFACGGTLVGSRQFLTAAHCLVSAGGLPLPPTIMTVRLGDVDLADATEDNYGVVDPIDRHPGFVRASRQNDVAMLTLDRVARYPLMRVVDDNEDARWAPGTAARAIGWGELGLGVPSDTLREADIPILTGDRCGIAYGAQFDPEVMICAAPDPGADPSEAQDICVGDGGGPLLVRDSAGGLVLAGVAALDTGCGDPEKPGLYTRVGDNFAGSELNSWVHDRTPEADFDFDHAPRANELVTLTSTSRYPPPGSAGDTFFDTFKWDLDNDGVFDDASGKSVQHRFPTDGEQVTGLEASNRAAGDKAVVYYSFNVGADPNLAPTVQIAPVVTTPAPRPAAARPAAPRVTISSAKRPKVGRRGRFVIRVRFARAAPRGTAVIEVFRVKRKIGIARTRVSRGVEKRVKVKLTPTGRRLLKGSKTKRLKVRVRIRVGKQILRSKTLTIRR